MSLNAGMRLGPYEIEAAIGAGGMGEIYRARDPRLDRVVAIKVLPSSLAADPDRLRLFAREARAVAALNHANVLAVYDVGTHDGIPYLVTELLEGRTLRARLADGPLPVAKAIEMGVQIARGMAAAHEKGIVHRDIKPENLFLTTDGTVKILDFGVAALRERRRPEQATAATRTGTETGIVQGTVGYMAPEQARGQPSDHRADIFAFGCVLYEMLAGARAFSGDSVADTLAALLTRDPPPLDRSGRAIPVALRELVRRCLEKEPHERFSSAHDLALALSAVSGREVIGGSRTAGWLRRHRVLIASTTTALLSAAALLIWTIGSAPVLSFAPRDWVLVADVDNQTGERIFDKSLATAFVVSLEQSTHANVFPRSRVAAALQRMGRTDAAPLNELLGREICVREKIRGLIIPTISKVGRPYSLTARIVDPATGDTVRSYIRTADTQDAVLSALGSLAATIRRDLGESLAAINVSNRNLPQVTTSSLEALSMFAEASTLWSKGLYDQALQLYLSALKADPDFAMAHAAVGNVYYSHIFNNPAEGKAHLERAMQLSRRTTQREAQMIEIDYEQGLGHFDKVSSLYEIYLKTYPDDFRNRYNYGNALRDHGNFKEALAQYRDVLRVAPGDASALINLATCYNALDKHREALDAYAKAFALEPSWITSGNLNHEYGFTWVRAGDLAKAEEVFNKGMAASNKPLSTRSLALLDMYRGKYRRAIARLHEAILLNQSAKVPLSEARNQLFMAAALEAIGDARESTAALERAAGCIRQTTGQVWLAARIGIEQARRGAVDKSTQMLAKAQAEAEPTNPQQSSDIHRLQGEIELARGRRDRGIELLLLADRENASPLTAESLARAHRLSHHTDEALAAYASFLAMEHLSLGWESQQGWIDAHYWLADLYAQRGDARRALPLLDDMVARWKDADPDLPMLKRASELRTRLTAASVTAVGRRPGST